MSRDIDILNELDPNIQKKPKSFTILIYLFIAYISEVLMFSLISPFNFTSQTKSIEWETIFLILLLPVIGLILFFQKVKIGWAICLFYYSALSIFLLVIFVQNFLKEGIDIFHLHLRWQGCIFVLTTLVSFFLLLSKNIRSYLNIKPKSFVTTLIICIVLILTIFFVMQN